MKIHTCSTASITFLEINENLSGRYSCKSIMRGPTDRDPPGLYIYGGNEDNPPGSLMINRGQNFKKTAGDPVASLWPQYVDLPCGVSFPVPVSTSMTINNGTVEKEVNLTNSVHYCKEGMCVDSYRLLQTHPTLRYSDIRSFCCSTTTCRAKNESVILTIERPHDFYAFPVEKEMTVNAISISQKVNFTCRSIKPVTMNTNYSHVYRTINTRSPKHYYEFRSELDITIPDWSDLRWEEIHVSVSCLETTGNKILYTWNYLLINSDTKQYSDSEGRISYSQCSSSSSSTIKVYFVPCLTYNECQMVVPLLYSDTSHRILNTTFSNFDVTFKLPVGLSGMVRCAGYRWDTMLFVYKGLPGELQQFETLSTTALITDSFHVNSPLVSTNDTEIFENDDVRVNCTSPLMVLMTHPYWKYVFRNGTSSIIPAEFITNSSSEIKNSLFIISAKIKILTIDVTAILCANFQYKTAPVLTWKEGTLQRTGHLGFHRKQEMVPIKVKVKPIEQHPQSKIGIFLGSTFAALFLIALFAAIAVFLRFRAHRQFIDQLREEEIDFFLLGRPDLISDSENANTNAENSAYDNSYEINFDDMEIDYKTILGAGQFGVVFKGVVVKRETKEKMTVAIKTMKPGACVDYLRATMTELKIMLYIKYHENIVRVVGACTSKLMSHEIFVAMDFCDNGNLLSYIRNHSDSFGNEVNYGSIDLNAPVSENAGMRTRDLIKWTIQIACGMKYIASLNIIHGDLAARNVLLDHHLIAKISDFGLSKRLYQYTQYVKKSSVPLPWRWLAIETLQFTEFSLASDVWAYGVTLWEIFSLGLTPYPGQVYNPEFIQMLTDGFRLPLPEFAPYPIYRIILNCWKRNTNDRPNFHELYGQLKIACGDCPNADYVVGDDLQTSEDQYMDLNI